MALVTAWLRLGLEEETGCTASQAALYFIQHLDASIPFLQRLGAQPPPANKLEEPPMPCETSGLPPEYAHRLNLSLAIATHLQDAGYEASDALYAATQLTTAR